MSQFKASVSKGLPARGSEAKSSMNGPRPQGKNTDVFPLSLPSHFQNASEIPTFNSIGYYGDLISQLDGQINDVEGVFKNCFMQVKQNQTEHRQVNKYLEANISEEEESNPFNN